MANSTKATHTAHGGGGMKWLMTARVERINRKVDRLTEKEIRLRWLMEEVNTFYADEWLSVSANLAEYKGVLARLSANEA